MTPEQERVSSILLDTVALLCKNSLSFTTELKVQGLIGITVDGSDIFLVHINEHFHPESVESVKQEPTEVGDHRLQRPSLTVEEVHVPKRQPNRKPVSRPMFNQSDHSNLVFENDDSYNLNSNIKSENVYDDPTSTFGEYGYIDDTVMPSKVKPISMMRQTQVTYGRSARASTVASTIVTEAYNMLKEEEGGLESYEEHQEQEDEMPWDSGEGLFQHPSQPDPAPDQIRWTGQVPTSSSSGHGFGHKVKHSMRGRGKPGVRGRQPISAPSTARPKPSPSEPYVINEVSHLCGYPNCGKRFRLRRDLLRHQTKKHGRTPVGRGRYHRVESSTDFG